MICLKYGPKVKKKKKCFDKDYCFFLIEGQILFACSCMYFDHGVWMGPRTLFGSVSAPFHLVIAHGNSSMLRSFGFMI